MTFHIENGASGSSNEPFTLISKRTTNFHFSGLAYDTPNIIGMDSAVGTGADPVMMDINGLITINQDCDIAINAIYNSSRVDVTGYSLILVALMVNGETEAAVENTTVVSAYIDNLSSVPTTRIVKRKVLAGDTLQLKVWADSTGDDVCALLAHPNNTFPFDNLPAVILTVEAVAL